MKRRPEGEVRFTVALVSDTHVNEKEDFSASPYPVNAEANPRARHIFAQINQAAPAFTIHLGDMINPVPELPSYGTAVDNFNRIAQDLNAPLHLMPGNHDIGDKPVSWMPAGVVNEEHIALYEEHFGRHYFSFDHEDCHFVILNSPLINSGIPAEAEQAAWLEADLAENGDKRTFLFSHYPLYVLNPQEPESYDNIDEPGRCWLLGLIQRYKPEALFTAHVHNFWYDVIGETEYYVVPSTCFVRHDYSEMYRIDGGDQQGRNDAAKLGHVTLEIHERGHVAHYHRSYGATMMEGGEPPSPVLRAPHTKTSNISGVYVDMRHAWAEEMVIAPSGAVDEFRRKKARNDYPVMAMWEMGLRGLRVPLQDLVDPVTRRRMTLMCDVGHRFHVYRYGMPDAAEVALLAEHRQLVERLELVLGWDEVDSLRDALRDLGQATGISLILSRVNRKDAAKMSGGRFNHLISHGFSLEETEELADFTRANSGLLSGFQFTIMRSVDPWQAAASLRRFIKTTGLRAVLYVKSTEASAAQTFHDETANAERFAQAVLAGVGNGVDVVLDTFDDADRGYFTRTGLVDRRFNPRIAGRLLSALMLRLNEGEWHADPQGRSLRNAKGETLSVLSAGESVPATGIWHCPLTGQTGSNATLDRQPTTRLVVIETPARKSELA